MRLNSQPGYLITCYCPERFETFKVRTNQAMTLTDFTHKVASKYGGFNHDLEVTLRNQTFKNTSRQSKLLLYKDIGLMKDDIVRVKLGQNGHKAVTERKKTSNSRVNLTSREGNETNPYEEHQRSSLKKDQDRRTFMSYVEARSVIKRIKTETSSSRLGYADNGTAEEDDSLETSMAEECISQAPHVLNLRSKQRLSRANSSTRETSNRMHTTVLVGYNNRLTRRANKEQDISKLKGNPGLLFVTGTVQTLSLHEY